MSVVRRVALLLALVLAPGAQAADSLHGRMLFREGCSGCHGLDARGVHARGPSLHGVGAAAADFYLSTGRMPIDDPRSQPERHRLTYSQAQLDDLVAYIGSLGGPEVPSVDVVTGSVSDGQALFTRDCAACHQIVARGGVVTGGFAPTLLKSTPRQIAEAIRIGPWVMPRFGPDQISDRDIASIARYVEYAKHPDNRGGWGLFDIGPVPEGMVAWGLGLFALLVFIRLIGKRDTE